MMRDWEVRHQLDRWLIDIHAQEPHTKFVPEMVLGRGISRIDYAVVNGKLHGYEIKSDADTLERLAAQSEAYNAVFDEITIVVGPRHLVEVTKIVPVWWGIMIAEPCAGSVTLSDFRPTQNNPQRSARALADLLWKQEALELLQSFLDSKIYRRKTRSALSAEIAERVCTDTVASFTREALKNRVGWRVDERPK